MSTSEQPSEGWARVDLHGHLEEIGPSDEIPHMLRVRVMVPPAAPGGADPRVDALADQISRFVELGAGLDELERDAPESAAAHRALAANLLPWLMGGEKRDLRRAYDAGHRAGRLRGAAGC